LLLFHLLLLAALLPPAQLLVQPLLPLGLDCQRTLAGRRGSG
jgi:hypothetical protein